MGGGQLMTPCCERLCSGLKMVKPYLAMVSLQFGYAGLYVIVKVSLNHGMSHFVLAVYRHAVATLVIAPFALVLERKIRPKMTFPIFLRIMLLGLIEPVLDQNLYYRGMKYTSATFAAATLNVVPAVTFIMAVILRLETVNVKKIHSLAKVIGTAVTVMGAMVMTLYKGPVVDIMRSRSIIHSHDAATSGHHWVTGTVMLLVSSFCWASFIILQSLTLKEYPAELSLTALICLMGTVEGAAVSLVFERHMSVWVIGLDTKLLAAVYSGVLCSGASYYLQGVVIRERGPVFATSFGPLCMIITAALGSIVLAEKIHLGSIIGAIFIVLGLYTVVWGKSKDQRAGLADPSGNEKLVASSVHELPITDVKSPIEIGHGASEAAGSSVKDALPRKLIGGHSEC